MNLSEWMLPICAILSLVIIGILVYLYMKKESLDNHINDVLARTGGSSGSYVTNLWETTQPAQGPQNNWQYPSYQYAWVGNDPSTVNIGYHRVPEVMPERIQTEHLVDNRCSSYGRSNEFLEKHLNVRNPDGSLNWTAYDGLFGPSEAEIIKATKIAERKNQMVYDDCMRRLGNEELCSVPIHGFVTDKLREAAYYG